MLSCTKTSKVNLLILYSVATYSGTRGSYLRTACSRTVFKVESKFGGRDDGRSSADNKGYQNHYYDLYLKM